MVEQRFFEYARQCTPLPPDMETYAERPGAPTHISTQHLSLIANETRSNGIGTLYSNDLYCIEKIIASDAGLKVSVNGAAGEWDLDCFRIPS